MTQKFHQYYENGFSLRGLIPLLWSTITAVGKRKRMAALNRLQDYIALQKTPQLYKLHKDLHLLLEEGHANWESYDYGEGYFYQSLNCIQVSGFRDTDGRFAAMQLAQLLKDKTVLEIGCNAGFLSLLIAEHARHVTGFDLAPHLVKIACRVAEQLDQENVTFQTCSFEAFPATEKYDAVLSFANHSTYDGNSNLDLETFFDRCLALIAPGGIFLFESHPPGLEDEAKLAVTCEIIEQKFTIEERKVLNYGSFLDQNRTFITARPK